MASNNPYGAGSNQSGRPPVRLPHIDEIFPDEFPRRARTPAPSQPAPRQATPAPSQYAPRQMAPPSARVAYPPPGPPHGPIPPAPHVPPPRAPYHMAPAPPGAMFSVMALDPRGGYQTLVQDPTRAPGIVRRRQPDGGTVTPQREKRHICEECGAAFDRTAALDNHRRTHTGERPFECPQCRATFNTTGNLRRHQRDQHA